MPTGRAPGLILRKEAPDLPVPADKEVVSE